MPLLEITSGGILCFKVIGAIWHHGIVNCHNAKSISNKNII